MGDMTKRRPERLFGVDEYGFLDLPKKRSGVMIARYTVPNGCCICFPYGYEHRPPKRSKKHQSWKTNRKKQYKRG